MAHVAPGGARSRSPSLAAFLSFLWPGLGQWYLDRRRSALIFAIPVAIAALALLIQSIRGLTQLALEMFTPSFALTALVLIGLLCAWRLLAIVDAAQVAGGRRAFRRPAVAGTVAALALVTIVVHGVLGYYAWSFYQAGSDIFVGLPGPDNGVAVNPSASTQGPILNATPAATPATTSSRINVLLTGIDSSPTRSQTLNDTIIVVSIDPVSKQVAMLSFPRDLSNLPMWNGRIYKGKINSLMTYAQKHPKEFPDGGLPTLMKELGFLLGIPMHYYAAIDLAGFVRMVDLVGGVTVDNPRLINDPGYGGWTDGRPIGFRMTPGKHRLNGQTALAYVRSRRGVGDNDFTRSRRQQQVLVALGMKLADPAMLPKLPDIVRAAGDTIRSSFPPDRLNEMLEIGTDLDDPKIKRYVLGPPYAIYPKQSSGIYELVLDMDRIARLSINLFGAESAYSRPAQPSSAP
jgi:polyisoprenyl-teichoic acid--peptidoglycan teichoic acid transferase